jgi:hypothetical protein
VRQYLICDLFVQTRNQAFFKNSVLGMANNIVGQRHLSASEIG